MSPSLFRRLLQRSSRGSLLDTKAAQFLLWAPQYDSLTQQLGEWVHDLPLPRYLRSEIFLNKLTKHDIQISLQKQMSVPKLAIFLGHGTPHALLGPPQVAGSSDLPAPIYSEDMVMTGPDSLFAFCSSAGEQLGKHFASIAGRAFLGYKGPLAIDISNEECNTRWKEIIIRISLQIIKDGTVLPRHKELLENLYDEAYEYFASGPGRMNPHRVLMQMYLLQHKQHLVLWRNDQ